MMKHRGRRIGYIPSGPEPTFRFFHDRQNYYGHLNLSLDLFFDLDAEIQESRLEGLFACDAIHLSGGDTQTFLSRILTKGLQEPLRRWANNGGVLIGTSAGAMLMTPTIVLDAIYNDSNPEHVSGGEALGLVPFEFFPHISSKPKYLAAVTAYSKGNGRPVAACPDGDGIVISNGKIECLGNVAWLADGEAVEPCEYIDQRTVPLLG